MRKLSTGKLRGLQQLANNKGIMTMCALDHRGSLKKMLSGDNSQEVSYQAMVDFKLDLCRILGLHASAILLDPIYGAAQAVSVGVLPKSTGLLVSMEESGYSGDSGERITTLVPDWSVHKIKKMGASAAKLLLYYRPDASVASRQLDMVRQLADDCLAEDIPLVVEPVSYRINEEKEDFAGMKPELVIETAKQITSLPIDLLKAEFPADPEYQQDKGKWLELCHKLDEASAVPWVILSAGVNYDIFCQQVETACRAGASGFLGGRALWQEATRISSRKARASFLETIVVERLTNLTGLANAHGAPWHTRFEACEVDENWHRSY
ncbi:MAG: tagatose 1,6-diphosphate aldolase [Dehalococcoidia bacterium]|nr:tagatose 1,6-diphosphate aldolase [Dehalococcoidia bacterium]